MKIGGIITLFYYLGNGPINIISGLTTKNWLVCDKLRSEQI